MKDFHDSIQNRIQSELGKNAVSYLRLGLDLFHREHLVLYGLKEPVIGNLAIAVELMLKTFLVKQNPLLIFKELPLELKVLFACPDKINKNSFSWRAFDIELRNYAHKTIGLNELISTFLLFFPDHKQALRPHLRFLSQCRNASIHLSLPSFQAYELERTVYVALKIFEIINDHDSLLFHWYRYDMGKRDQEFMSKYDIERTERVRKKIESANDKAKKIDVQSISIISDDWQTYVTQCPVCSSDGLLFGETDLAADVDEDGSANAFLIFNADTFECEGCGLILDDATELQLAGMSLTYDRPENELDDWLGDNRYDYEDDYWDDRD